MPEGSKLPLPQVLGSRQAMRHGVSASARLWGPAASPRAGAHFGASGSGSRASPHFRVSSERPKLPVLPGC